MVCAVGSRSSLSYIEEVTFGTTPAGDFQTIPYSTHSLNLTKEALEGTDIIGDRKPRVNRHGNRQVGGDIVFNLRTSEYDTLLESAMLSTWTGDVLSVGVTPKYFTFQDYAADIDQARIFTGCTVNTMGISISPNEMITTTLGIVGKDMEITATEVNTLDEAGEEPFDSYSGALQLGDTGGALSTVGYVTSLEINLDNGYDPQFAIGSASVHCMPYGRSTITGSLTAFYEDAALITRFLDETETALSVSVNDPTGSNEYTFFMPRVKLNSAETPVDGEGVRSISLEFVALNDDDTTDEIFTITRPTTP